MAKTKGEVKLGSYTLKYTHNALAEAEEALNKPFSVIAASFANNECGIRDIRAIFWAGLLNQLPNLTIREAGTIMDDFGLSAVCEAISEAISLAFPASENTDPNPPQAEAGTGTASKNQQP